MRTTHLKDGISARIACMIMAASAVVCALLSFLNPMVFAVFASAAFTLLFMYDTAWHPYTLVGSVLSCGLVAVLDFTLLPVCVLSVAVGACIAWFYRSGRPKFDAALSVVGLYLLMFVLLLWIQAALTLSTASPAAAVTYYTEQLALVKKALLDQLGTMLPTVAGLTEVQATELVTLVVDGMLGLLPAALASLCLIMTGACCKLVSFSAARLDADGGEQMRRFRFATPVLFAYFYAVVFVLSLFTDNTSVVGLCIGNLQLFFMCMYAYVGFKYLRFLARRMRRRNPLVIVLLVMLFIVPTVAIQLLSLEGVVAVITANRMQKSRHDTDDTEQ